MVQTRFLISRSLQKGQRSNQDHTVTFFDRDHDTVTSVFMMKGNDTLAEGSGSFVNNERYIHKKFHLASCTFAI